MVPISPEIYSGAAVVMDNRSLFDYIQKLEDRRAKRALAEQEAADNAIKDLSKNLTPAGMRTQDIPDLLKIQQDFRVLEGQYRGTKNPLKLFELQKKADEMFLFINESKQAAKEAESPTSILSDPNKINKVDFERLGGDFDKHNLPLKNPDRVKLGNVSDYFFPEQYDEVSTFNEASKGIEKSEFPATVVGKDKVIPKAYGDDAIRAIADNYTKLVSINPIGLSYYKGKLKDKTITPSQKIVEAELKVKKYFPKLDIDENDPKLLMLFDAIDKAELRRSQDIQNAPRISVSTGGAAAQGPVRDLYTEIDRATSSPQRLKADKGAPVNILSGAAQNALIKLANDVTGKDDYSQEKIYVKKFSDGKNYIVDVQTNEPLVPFTKEDINIGAQVDVKGKRSALTGQVPVPAAVPKKSSIYEIKGKRYTEQELLGMGYTRDQIAPYIKK